MSDTAQNTADSVPPLTFLIKQAEFAYELFAAAENEARSGERYLLVAVGGIYSYLLTHATDVARSFGCAPWLVPPILVVFAGVRAAVLAVRQAALLRYLKTLEERAISATPGVGWAHAFQGGPPVLSMWAFAFYIAFFILTTIAAISSCCLHGVL